MVNNAGIGTGGSLHELDPEEIDRCLDINLKGVLYGAQAAYPYLQKTAPGSALINIAQRRRDRRVGGYERILRHQVRGTGRVPKASMPNGRLIASPSPRFARASSKPRCWMARATASRTNRSATGCGLPGWKSRRSRKSPGRCGTRLHGDKLDYFVGKTSKTDGLRQALDAGQGAQATARQFGAVGAVTQKPVRSELVRKRSLTRRVSGRPSSSALGSNANAGLRQVQPERNWGSHQPIKSARAIFWRRGATNRRWRLHHVSSASLPPWHRH